ncbi:hypothetical protein D8X55_00740 [Malacoplasma penetrans]|uniref:Uncharacterized protein n=1 Tax=Malacoplasma penetrans (strain HF-2) TaxID=272633 RepID=Q8EVZ2_MALP2|nr:hypothetical protein [Malacoplasma penetrans]RXY97213.1 hypothetical protein D8X55_00740 [Malacoplasma penetrans]BAC44205.1 hypothetical protein [Malacoplasma penetrans HF-2]
MNSNNIKIPFWEKIKNKQNIERIKSKLELNERSYIVTIRSLKTLFNTDFDLNDRKERVEKENMLDELTDLIHNLIVIFKQPYLYTKKTIREILDNFLPFTFFVSLTKEEAVRVFHNIKSYENSGLGVVETLIRKEANPDFSVFTWSSNFYDFDKDFYSNFHQENSLNFFNFFNDVVLDNYYDNKIFRAEDALEVYGTKPIVLLSDLKLEEAIYGIYHFQKKFSKQLPFDFLVTDTRSLKRQKNKVLPHWID